MKSDRDQVAHLMRRAGFGATADELDYFTKNKEYSEIVDDLVNPQRFPEIDQAYLDRYYFHENMPGYVTKWLFRMLNSQRVLQEKMALFLHHVLPAAYSKCEHGPALFNEIDMFRSVGLTNFKTILLELSKDPAMIYWLDNNENHEGEINENYGRELLELFSMGVGNYTEDDIKNASRAFTGWTFTQPIPIYPQGHFVPKFEFRSDRHDYGDKTFLGQNGKFNGEDIIDIIVKQPATARFVCRHLSNFFVEDEPQVPAWDIEPPHHPELVDHLSRVFLESDGNMRVVLSNLFNSEEFKSAYDRPKVKSPTELVVGVLRQVGTYRDVRPGLENYLGTVKVMGQELLNPPTVEGWHTGQEWIDSGTLSERINFASSEFGNIENPGVKDIIQRVGSLDNDPEQLVDRCLDVLGNIKVTSQTRQELMEYIEILKKQEDSVTSADLIQMVVSTVDYQYA
tara:strand:- start:2169 stop:3530 length:1362 start_codon:yes stop_codon:yes gene_type:complete